MINLRPRQTVVLNILNQLMVNFCQVYMLEKIFFWLTVEGQRDNMPLVTLLPLILSVIL